MVRSSFQDYNAPKLEFLPQTEAGRDVEFHKSNAERAPCSRAAPNQGGARGNHVATVNDNGDDSVPKIEPRGVIDFESQECRCLFT